MIHISLIKDIEREITNRWLRLTSWIQCEDTGFIPCFIMWILHTKYKISMFLYFKTVQTDFFFVLLYGRKYTCMVKIKYMCLFLWLLKEAFVYKKKSDLFTKKKKQVKIVSDTMCKHEIVSCPSTLSAIYHLHYAIFHVTSAGIQEYKSTFQFNTRLVVIIENCGYNL